MLALLVSWGMSAAALAVAGRLFRNVKLKGDFGDALWIAALYSVLSFFLHWLLFGVFALFTLGLSVLFSFITHLVVAAIVLRFTSALSSRFDIKGFIPALGTAGLLALASELGQRLLAGL